MPEDIKTLSEGELREFVALAILEWYEGGESVDVYETYGAKGMSEKNIKRLLDLNWDVIITVADNLKGCIQNLHDLDNLKQ